MNKAKGLPEDEARAAVRSGPPVDSLARPWKSTDGWFISRRSISLSICCGMPRSIAIVKVAGV